MKNTPEQNPTRKTLQFRLSMLEEEIQELRVMILGMKGDFLQLDRHLDVELSDLKKEIGNAHDAAISASDDASSVASDLEDTSIYLSQLEDKVNELDNKISEIDSNVADSFILK